MKFFCKRLDDVEIEMSLPNSADLPQVIEVFGSFLKACGYVFEGIELSEPEELQGPDFETPKGAGG